MVASWPILVDQFSDNSGLHGPMPVFFTEDVEHARAQLAEEQDTLFQNLK